MMFTAAGIDVSPNFSYLCKVDETGRMEAWPKVGDFEVAEQCKSVDIVVIETPQAGQGWRTEAIRNIMPTIHHAGELAGMLSQVLGKGQFILQPNADVIRLDVAGIEKFSKGNHDAKIMNWLKRIHLPGELGLDYEAVQSCFQRGKGPLSTADKRDAYMAARWGIRLLTNKSMQLSRVGKFL